MAENYVSKFVVDSGGTDIDVIIKDSSARSMIAEEITDRNKLIKKVEDDTVIESTENVAISANKIKYSEPSNIDGVDGVPMLSNTNKEYGLATVKGVNDKEKTINNSINAEISNRKELIEKNELGQTVLKSDSNVVISSGDSLVYSEPRLVNGVKGVPMKSSSGVTYYLATTDSISTSGRFKNFIVIGDSWADGTGSETGKGWGEILKSMLDYDTWYGSWFGGSGFMAPGTGQTDHTFLYLLKQLENQVTDKAKIDCILVGGGVNDLTYTSTQLQGAIEQFVEYATTKYPNAIVWFVYCNTEVGGNTSRYAPTSAFSSVINKKYLYTDIHTIAPGECYVNNLHLNNAGYTIVADNIKKLIYGSPTGNGYHTCGVYGLTAEGTPASENINVTQTEINGTVVLEISGINTSASVNTSSPPYYTIDYKNPTGRRGYLHFNEGTLCIPIQPRLQIAGAEQQLNVPGSVSIDSEKVRFQFEYVGDASLNSFFFEGLKTIYLKDNW